MNLVIAYCPDVTQLRINLQKLYDEGKYKRHIKLRPTLFGPPTKVVLTGAQSKGPVDMSEDGNTSVCTFAISHVDVYGNDEDPTYVPLLEAVGLEALAFGINQGGDNSPEKLLQQDHVALAKYESVKPRIQHYDEQGNPLGEPVFNQSVSFAI